MLTAIDKQNIKEGSTEIAWNEKNKYNKLNVKCVFRAKKWRQSADRGFVTGFYNIDGERVCNIHLYLIEMKQQELDIFVVMWDGSSQMEPKMIFQNNILEKIEVFSVCRLNVTGISRILYPQRLSYGTCPWKWQQSCYDNSHVLLNLK